ncbi:MAG: hypothetical protein ABIZ49_02930, partial [Opitutaceae bacterium]
MSATENWTCIARAWGFPWAIQQKKARSVERAWGKAKLLRRNYFFVGAPGITSLGAASVAGAVGDGALE